MPQKMSETFTVFIYDFASCEDAHSLLFPILSMILDGLFFWHAACYDKVAKRGEG